MSTYRFNTPPGWPVPPPQWVPPAGWKPDPTWPAAPLGWNWWIPAETPTGQTKDMPLAGPSAAHPPVIPGPATTTATPAYIDHSASVEYPARAGLSTYAGRVAAEPPVVVPPAAIVAVPSVSTGTGPNIIRPVQRSGRGGLFGGKKQLEEENEELRRQLTTLLGLDPTAVANEASALQTQVQQLQAEQRMLHGQLARLRAELVRTSEEAELQEVGIYQYRHPLANALAYKAQLADLSDRIKSMARGGTAVQANNGWTVNGSAAEGRKMVREYTKLMLRAYNAEADSCVSRVQPHRRHATVERLDKVANTIAKLGKTMGIRIDPEYHRLRAYEIDLTADYRAKLEEEKERIREERERQREERAATAELEREKARLAKEQSHYQAALAKLQAKGDDAGVAELAAKLSEIDEAIAGVEERAANVRAGYVYVISNIGAFGPRMVKIGMTRRLDPEDRVRELGDASVPFKFDTHALIFSEDAVGLEAKLHNALAEQRVNKVNHRREFFYADPAQVRDLLQEIAGQHLLAYHERAEALEWRASGAHQQQTQPVAHHSSPLTPVAG
ncbi:DUF4041 domain-containing protein [Micromonospora sp. NBC_01813]|uniref:DUF4041 domain-containing protein n=1 Tax=Micromonospora sp. NBC_01813 TaxID=2975988 RepID=UPI002DD900B0|nr:DUF4041 domain-containing protein [Micromonospora sp. NBC_01813]WSA08741.1 DUF4041 domain-containing protein [Micromonospora sp. NBC_01813]